MRTAHQTLNVESDPTICVSPNTETSTPERFARTSVPKLITVELLLALATESCSKVNPAAKPIPSMLSLKSARISLPPSADKTKISLPPAPPVRKSLPKSPQRISDPSPPRIVSLSLPPRRVSFPSPPSNLSSPSLPFRKSSPAPPQRVSLGLTHGRYM